MTDLLIRRSAVLSGPGACYRDELRRVWDDRLPMLVVCMLNPSDADHEREDPTLHALIWFGRRWGYGGLLVVNLYAFRSPSPSVMFSVADRVGPDNGRHIQAAIDYACATRGSLLAAWGNDGNVEGRAEWFAGRAVSQGVTLMCLGITRNGSPKHPLARGKHRVPRDQQPVVWRAAP